MSRGWNAVARCVDAGGLPERCQQAPVGTAPGLPGACREDAAEALAGKPRISDAEARQATGAAIVRQIGPGQGVTMDYRRERLTIETDPKTGKVIRAYCG